MQHRRLRHRHAPSGRSEVLTREVQKHRAAAAGDAWMGIVIDLDDKIIEVIVAHEPITAFVGIEPHRLIVMAAAGGFAPGVVGPDGADRQECAWPGGTIGAPPYLPRAKGALGGAAIPPAPVWPDA